MDTLRTLTANDMQAVNQEILRRMDSPVEMIPQIARHLIDAGGKRIRPMLTIASARIFNYAGGHHIELAAAVELIHGATLLHDDVVDQSGLRRGAKTANVLWGDKESVLVGDFLFSRAFELMVASQNFRVLEILSGASSIIAEGEVLQLATQNNVDTTFQMYIDVISAKTAALFSAATHAGAVISNASEAEEKALQNFGQYFGIAYQLVDDALDYVGFESHLGKTVGDDFRESKMTLPVVHAISRAREEERSFWQRVIGEGRQEAGDFERAQEYMKRDNALEDTVSCAKQYAERAMHELSRLEQNDYSKALGDLVQTSIARVS